MAFTYGPDKKLGQKGDYWCVGEVNFEYRTYRHSKTRRNSFTPEQPNTAL
jgi:hypothetical protein